ncbi:SubName: Full=Uncharacterized protein {ECO:0000313/EMBL:CCA68800.1} [Serendipita indica DSM 11827]|uniref:Vacuolar protein sorting-associated protein 51 homolog n=1 Tax=Serendipita indica (strain DSM 11827) TaxID=1109443 RepID=G4TBW3_SERID|nr:SubName: Full=Uncharacterized protein {ECO:0000313/EMBL:CCA68800.1} [Serendipita indica DSM 11827]CCA68800.1 hypothetical protein PIIN_02662 [Serendipita indica DSM 11827]
MNEELSPTDTPTLASMSQQQQQQRRPTVHKSSPLAMSATTPVTPETATYANTSRRVNDAPAPVISEPTPPASRPGAARTGTRARDLLRQHYGMGLVPPASSSGRADDPMDLDSKVFDAKAYYEQLITTTNLTGLLKKENELAAQIRQLDGERQSLVYNHHHELIAASDTIGAMKVQADSLDADLEKLRAAFSEISRLAAETSRDEDQQRS